MDVVYATPWVVGALVLHDVSNLMTAALVPLFVASWWQDWQSARAATTYFSGELVGFDLLTAGNYVVLVDGWRRHVPDGAWLSIPTLVAWTGVFVIYIAWNLAVMRKSDEATRRSFLKFSVAEFPLVAIGCLLIAAHLLPWEEPSWLPFTGVVLLAALHTALLVWWRLMSRKEQG